MCNRTTLLCLIFTIPFTSIVNAELTSVEIGGKIEIYGLYYRQWIEPSDQVRIPSCALFGRSIGPEGTYSAYRSGEGSTGTSYVEQRTRLHTKATMTDNISVFFEVDSIDTWGEDFRSQQYLTGKDNRADSSDDIELFQAYIQAKDFGINDLTFTVGRQAIDLGSGWLVGSDPGPNVFTGLSFDAIRLQYEKESWMLDVFYGKLFESMSSFNHDDIDFWSTYFTWKNIWEGTNIDFYYFLLRDNTNSEVTRDDFILEAIEGVLGRDNSDTTYIHTIGLRFYGSHEDWDYEMETAYQWGEGSAFGNLFVPIGGIYGDDDISWSLPAGHFEVGYTLSKIKWSPRVYLGGCYYDADDNRDVSFMDWFLNLDVSSASPSFNRLFSAYREENFIDISGMTNFWQVYSGVSVNPTEKVEVSFELSYLQTISPFDSPYSFSLGSYEFYPLGYLSFFTQENPKDLGWQTLLTLSYAYNEDLNFETGWSHFFVGDGIVKGAFLDNYGTSFISTMNDNDSDFFYIASTIEF
ncbi:MAG: alginate export family protein [Candidatus Hydrogenedens sp.]|nr:alginate export family protein [Candidatus Hydrogenedens sp.]